MIVALVVVASVAKAYSPAEIAAESRRANEFLDKCWDENLARHPVDESFYGIKTHYDQLEDISDEKVTADHQVVQGQLAFFKRDFKFDALDSQAQLSWKLFEREVECEANEFRFRFDVYPVSQMRGVHAQIPTFLINIHKIEDARDAETYIARQRLVVDTGLHDKRWTRQGAIDYLKQNTSNSETDCIDSINRYIVMPSQATAYKIGMLKILELREKAKKELGAKFDIRQFNEVVLTNGAIPLDVLEELVDRWVKSKQAM